MDTENRDSRRCPSTLYVVTPDHQESLRLPGSSGPRRQRTVRSHVMQAAIFAGPQHIEIKSVNLAEPGPHEVRVRLEGCGVCASNLPVWEGRPWFTYPLEPGAPGHEGWGYVDAVGTAVEVLSCGDRVAVV